MDLRVRNLCLRNRGTAYCSDPGASAAERQHRVRPVGGTEFLPSSLTEIHLTEIYPEARFCLEKLGPRF